MRKMNLFISAIIALALITSISLIAKGDECQGRKGKCGNERPKMTQKKADQLNQLKNDFDSKLSVDDLNSLNLLRQKVKTERLDMKTQIFEIKNSDISKDEKKTKIKALLEDNKDSKEEVKNTIKSILESNPKAIEELITGLKELKAGSKYEDKTYKKHRKQRVGHRLARFILQDEFIARENSIKDMVNNSEKLNISVTQDLLTFESDKVSSNSLYTLDDLSGNKISTKSNQTLITGENSINLSLFNTNIEKGRYFLVIENEHGLSAGKFIYLK